MYIRSDWWDPGQLWFKLQIRSEHCPFSKSSSIQNNLLGPVYGLTNPQSAFILPFISFFRSDSYIIYKKFTKKYLHEDIDLTANMNICYRVSW